MLVFVFDHLRNLCIFLIELHLLCQLLNFHIQSILLIEQVTNFPILGVCDTRHVIQRLGLMGLLDLRQLLGEFLFLLLLLHE